MARPNPIAIALDQNFPTPILSCVAPFVPDIRFDHVQKIDARLATLADWQLVVALHRRGYQALASNDYHMIDQPRVVLAAEQTRTSLILIESLGDDPLRATGALLLDIAYVAARLPPRRAVIYRIKRNNPQPMATSEAIRSRATRLGTEVRTLRKQEKLSRSDLDDPLEKLFG